MEADPSQVSAFLSRISSLSAQVVNSIKQPSTTSSHLEGNLEQLRRAIVQLDRLNTVIDVEQYQQLMDELLELQRLGEEEVTRMRDKSKHDSAYNVPKVNTGARGAPRYSVTKDQLQLFLSADFSNTDMAKILQVSVSTIERRLRLFNLKRPTYSELTNQELDNLVRKIVAVNRSIGYRSVHTILKNDGYRLKFDQVRHSLLRVDAAGVALRWGQTLQRRAYHVERPNALWHIDGNHKLIRWRFVIHGGIDGFSRTVVFLNVSDNNRSSTVLRHFLKGTSDFGVPSRVRSDYGGENVDVAEFMLLHSGTGRGSIITGSSTHNQRIERFWRDLMAGCTKPFYDLFHSLEDENLLDVEDDQQMFALHYVYLPLIQAHIDRYVTQHNHHPIRTEHSRTPLQLFISGAVCSHKKYSNRASGLFTTTQVPVTAHPDQHSAVDEGQHPPDEDHQVNREEADNMGYPGDEVVQPTVPSTLSPQQLRLLHEKVHPVQDSRGGLGKEVYLQTLSEIRNMLQEPID